MANVENIRKWVDALRSGEFAQGQKALCDADGRHCCLGVAAELTPGIVRTKRNDLADADQTRFDDSLSFLPERSARWLGLDLLKDDGDESFLWILTSRNDQGVPFSEIADAIEAKYL